MFFGRGYFPFGLFRFLFNLTSSAKTNFHVTGAITEYKVQSIIEFFTCHNQREWKRRLAVVITYSADTRFKYIANSRSKTTTGKFALEIQPLKLIDFDKGLIQHFYADSRFRSSGIQSFARACDIIQTFGGFLYAEVLNWPDRTDQ